MKSNKSLFSATLFKSNIVRFLPFSILFLIIELINFPLVIFFNYNIRNSIDFDSLISMSGVSYAFCGIFAIVFALLTFGYLFSANKCNALHAFPIGRKALFTTNLLSAYAMLVVPQLIGFLLGLPGILMFSLPGAVKAFIPLHLAMIFLFSFIVLSIGIIAIMLSGNAFAGVIIYGILNFLYTAVVMLASYAVAFFGYGLNETVLMGNATYYLSPAVNIVALLSDYKTTEIKKDVIVNINPDFYIALAIYFAVAIAICALAFLLYKLRELEVAGEMAAFEQELPFIRVIVSVIGATLLAMSIGAIVNAGKVVMIILYVVFSFIVYFATQMVLKKKFNIFSGKLILRWVICCAVSIGVVLGLAAFETNYIPEASKVDSTKANISYSINSKDEKTTAQIQELQKALIEYSKKNRTVTGIRYAEDYDYEDEVSPNKLCFNITFDYVLKNGKVVLRAYEYEAGDKKIDALIKAIESENKYQSMFDFLDETGVKYTVSRIEISSYEDNYEDGIEHTVNPGYYDKVMELCREDVDAITSNYSSLNNSNSTGYTDVWITCKLDKDNDKKVLEAIEEASYSSTFIEGYISYADYLNSSANANEFEMNISSLPKDSKTVQFAVEREAK